MAKRKGFNKHIINDDVTTVILDRKNGEKLYAYIDTEELPRFIAYQRKWSASWDSHSKSYYVHVTIYVGNENGKDKYTKLSMQCFILNTDTKAGYKIDHINHNTLDNRKFNLRVTVNDKNTKHRKGANSNNSSGYRNVCWLKKQGKWCVQLQINGKNTRLGFFDNVHEAGDYAEKMREKYYGEFAGIG